MFFARGPVTTVWTRVMTMTCTTIRPTVSPAVLSTVLSAALALGAISFAPDRAVAEHIGRSLPALEPSGLIFAATSVDDMPPEMRQAYIRGIQEELSAHGYEPGPADGLLGPETRTAIRKYQRDAGLAVDGVASKELLDHLKFAQPRITAKPDPEPDPLVLEVQTRLRALGYHRGELDGLMGATTREAIRAYRYDAGLPINGAIDGPLLASLRPDATRKGESLEPGGAEVPERAETGEGGEDAGREPVPATGTLTATPSPAD